MKVVIAHHCTLPVHTYGGTERIVWWLGKELVRRGHEVTFLINGESHSNFAAIKPITSGESLNKQVPEGTELLHCFFQPQEKIDLPYLVTNQGNVPDGKKDFPIDQQTVFVSRNHAERHHANCYVYNGLDFEDYRVPRLEHPRTHLHFLAKVSWKAKNVKGAIEIAEASEIPVEIMGGDWFTSVEGWKSLLKKGVHFRGMVGHPLKDEILNNSLGLLFPVLWNEPFGIALIESLYFGCPVFGTPYGSLPEIITPEVGFLSVSKSELIGKIRESDFNPEVCHQYVKEHFSIQKMTDDYFNLYKKVTSGQKLNKKPPTAIHTYEEDAAFELID